MTHSKIQHYGPFVARIALALLFIVSGIGILMDLSGTAGYYASLGIPVAMVMAVIVMLVKLVAGLMLITGIHAREGAWALAVFTLLATLIAHTGEGQLVAALKNIAIIGGFLMVATHGAGPLSMASKCPCPRCKMNKAPAQAPMAAESMETPNQ